MKEDKVIKERTDSIMMQLYSSEEVGKKFLNRPFTENENLKLQSGGTINWKNMDIGGDRKRDLNIKMQTFINKDGQLEKGLSVQVKADKLIIPDKILDKKLNDEEKATLKEGNYFALEKEAKRFLIKVDPQVNAVTVRTPAEVGIKEELGGYKFGKDELARLANGQAVGPKVYNSPKYGYFVSNLEIKNEGNSFEYKYSNIVSISKKEAEKLMPIMNDHKGKWEENELNKVLDIMGGDKEIKPVLKESIAKGSEKLPTTKEMVENFKEMAKEYSHNPNVDKSLKTHYEPYTFEGEGEHSFSSGYIKTGEDSPWPQVILKNSEDQWIKAEVKTINNDTDAPNNEMYVNNEGLTEKKLVNIKTMSDKDAAVELLTNRKANNIKMDLDRYDRNHFAKSDFKEYMGFANSKLLTPNEKSSRTK